MELPKFNHLLLPTFEALKSLGGSASIDELNQRVIQDLQLPEELTAQPHGDGAGTEIEYRLAWARTYLKKFGLITNSERAVWSLTSKGQTVSKSERDKLGDETNLVAIDSSEEVASWRDRLLHLLGQLTPDAFERLCQRILRESGFIEVEVSGRSGDGGIDGRGIIRLAGLISFTVLFQAKRYKGTVGAEIVRNFRGALQGRADKGLIITTGGFTRDARTEATRDGAPPIDLIDGDLLVQKLKDLRLGVATKMVEAVEVDSGWYRAI